jgi:hypothetical protein
LDNELERINNEGKFNKKIRKNFYQKLESISKKFVENYPYDFAWWIN